MLSLQQSYTQAFHLCSNSDSMCKQGDTHRVDYSHIFLTIVLQINIRQSRAVSNHADMDVLSQSRLSPDFNRQFKVREPQGQDAASQEGVQSASAA